MRINKKGFILIFIFVALIISFGISKIISNFSHAEVLENDVEVEPNSTLTYFLNVSYDGKDLSSTQSSATITADVNSGYITVSDKIPEGLTFNNFVETGDGSIGAVKRGTEEACAGYVIDDTNDAVGWNSGNTEFTYHGLHYDASSRTVTFKVKNLKAGCELVVGINTTTPATVDDPATAVVEKRRDFWNFGTIKENDFMANSNIVHAYMGDANETLYNVKYEYTGTVPANAPSVPADSQYAQNAPVNVATPPSVEGYTFSGWSTTDATVTNNVFTMPNKTVTLRGSFTKIPESEKHKVTYQIIGSSPEGYTVPSEKTYYEGHTVEVDSLKPGDTINGYRFLGWETTDVTVSEENNFEMPNSDVTLTGKFELIKYNVEYRFYDTLLPAGWESLIPPTETHAPGENVALAAFPEAPGYRFLGWYADENFEMPEHDVIIYGEWMEYPGEFEIQIEKEITNPKPYYIEGDTVNFKIKVTNPETFNLKEVIVKEHLEEVEYLEGTGYEIKSPHFVEIPTLAAGASVEINAKYVVGDNKFEAFTNVAEVLGALSDNKYILKEGEYKAEVDFKKGQSKLVINKTNASGSPLTGAEFTLSKNTNALYGVIKDEAESGGLAKKYDGNPDDSFDTSQNTEDVYYYIGEPNNNLVFGDFCWQMVRTTSTGGIKLIYNGEYDEVNKCNNSDESKIIGMSSFGVQDSASPAHVGYMYNPDTSIRMNNDYDHTSVDSIYGNDVIYENGQYTLIDTSTTFDDTHHYSCNNASGTCSTVRYYYHGYYYVELNNGQTIEDALVNMFYADDVNKVDSPIKSVVDDWYQDYMLDYTSHLEDIVYCNDRYLIDLGGWDPNGSISGDSGSQYAYVARFKNNNYKTNGSILDYDALNDNTNLSCTFETDMFSVSNPLAKLTYPVGLLTLPEMNLSEGDMANSFSFLDIGDTYYWSISPSAFPYDDGYVGMRIYSSDNTIGTYYEAGVRPVVSLKPGTTYTVGTGTMSDPYVVENVTSMEDQTGLAFDLEPGEYTLRETKAPSGYQIDNTEYSVVVSETGAVTITGKTLTKDDNENIYTVNMINNEIDLLPNTGGLGVKLMILLGGLLVVGGVVGYNYNRKVGIKK